MAASYGNMGVALEKTGKYGELLEMHTKSLEINFRVHGDNHSDVAASKENTGLVLKAMGKKSEAKQMFTEAALGHTVLVVDHPLTK